MEIPKEKEMKKLAYRYMEDHEPEIFKARKTYICSALGVLYTLMLYALIVLPWGYNNLSAPVWRTGFLIVNVMFIGLAVLAWSYMADDKGMNIRLVDYYFEKVHIEKISKPPGGQQQ